MSAQAQRVQTLEDVISLDDYNTAAREIVSGNRVLRKAEQQLLDFVQSHQKMMAAQRSVSRGAKDRSYEGIGRVILENANALNYPAHAILRDITGPLNHVMMRIGGGLNDEATRASADPKDLAPADRVKPTAGVVGRFFLGFGPL